MFCSFSLLSIFSFAQTNTLPTNGSVGINTLNPSAALDVNGNMVVDSSVVIKDSLNVKKKLLVDQDIKVLGKSVFVNDGKFKNKLTINGLTKMNGNAKVFGNLKLMNLSSISNSTVLLTVNQNGKVGSFDKNDLLQQFYQPIATCLTDVNGNLLPMWKQNPNPNYGILFTGVDCPARVGIGTNNPEAKLDVKGNALFSGNVGVRVNYFTNPVKAFYINDLNNNNDIFSIMNNGVVNIRTDLTQNVKSFSVTDILTNEDVFRVMGNGTVYATKVIVQETPFPDYVFNSTYQLMPIAQLENYIAVNKHLPNMPTAKQVEKEGADIGEINRVLVEKVEELTLYTIQQQKSIDLLLKEVKKLKNK